MSYYSQEKPPYPGCDETEEELELLPGAPQDVVDAVATLVELPEDEQHVAWRQKSIPEIMRIMKHLRNMFVPWSCIAGDLRIFDLGGNAILSVTLRRQANEGEATNVLMCDQVGPNLNLNVPHYSPELNGVSICGWPLEGTYVIEYDYTDDDVTLTKLESLPFPVCDDEITTAGNVSPLVQRHVHTLNLNNHSSQRLWYSWSVRAQKMFLDACDSFELPWASVVTDCLEIYSTVGQCRDLLWKGYFSGTLHGNLVGALLTKEGVYDGRSPRLSALTVMAGERSYDFSGHFEITGSNPEYVSLAHVSLARFVSELED